jgi:hypothetical protein
LKEKLCILEELPSFDRIFRTELEKPILVWNAFYLGLSYADRKFCGQDATANEW